MSTKEFFQSGLPKLRINKALHDWGISLDIHTYLAGILLWIIAISSVVLCIQIWRKSHVKRKAYYTALCLITCVHGTLRGLYFCVDGYNTSHTFPKPVNSILTTIFLPSVASSFYLLFSVILAITKMRVVQKNFLKPCSITFVVILNFSFAIASDMLSSYFVQTSLLQLICMAYFSLFGLAFFIMYVIAFRRFYKTTRETARPCNGIQAIYKIKNADNYDMTVEESNQDGLDTSGRSNSSTQKKTIDSLRIATRKTSSNTHWLLPLTLVAATLFLAISLVGIAYISVIVYEMFYSDGYMNHWIWFGVQAVFRLLEVSQLFVILLVVYLAVNKRTK